MSSLSNELYSRIFEHLSIEDWKSTALISRNLNQLLTQLIFNQQVEVGKSRVKYRLSDIKLIIDFESLNISTDDVQRLTLNIRPNGFYVRVPNDIDIFKNNNFNNLISLIVNNRTIYSTEFDFFERLTRLEELTLKDIKKESSVVFNDLKYLINLKSLNIISCRGVNNDDLITINQLTSLRSLNLENSLHSFQLNLNHISSLIRLQYLNLSRSHIVFTWRTLSYFTRLKSLNLLQCRFFSILQDIEFVKYLIDIEELSIDLNYTDQVQEMYIQKSFKRLKLLKVDLYNWTNINDSFIESLQNMNLERLDSELLILKDDSLNRIKLKTNLKYLDVNLDFITDDGLNHLSQLLNLKRVKFMRCHQITDDGLRSLTRLTNLKYFKLIDCKRITNRGLTILNQLKRLRSINLGIDEGISTETLDQLMNLFHLKKMNIYKSRSAYTLDGMFHFKYLNQKRESNKKKQVKGSYIFHF